MESEDIPVKKTASFLKALKSIREGLLTVKRYALFLAFMLMGIWCAGRVIEAFSGTPVFEPTLICWMALFIWVMLGLFVVGAAVQYTRDLTAGYKQFPVIITWIFFGLLLAGTVYIAQGYRISTMSLFATASGMTDSAKQTLLLLFKSYPATPVLPINLVTAKAAGTVLEVDSLMPSIWGSPYLFGIFIWSLAYGTLLLRQRGIKVAKILHLTLAMAGVVAMMVMKATSTFTNEQLVFLHAGAVTVLFLQALLTYSCIRMAAGTKNEDTEEATPIGLPPSGLKFALFLLIILPILADIHNQFALASHAKPVIQELKGERGTNRARYATASQAPFRPGPALGDDTMRVSSNGSYLPVWTKYLMNNALPTERPALVFVRAHDEGHFPVSQELLT